MPPFQQWFIELISIISDILIGAAAIAAIIGLRQGRFELVGKTKFELARRIIRLAFEFHDELKTARRIFISPNESAERIKQVNENPDEAILLEEIFVRTRRLKPLKETFHKLQAAAWECRRPPKLRATGPRKALRHYLDFPVGQGHSCP